LKNDPLVSVCIMSYNLEDYIAEALDSVLIQKVNFAYEIIVGDDYSTDNTRRILKEYVEKYPHIKIIFHKKNLGMLGNFSATLRKCEGKYIALLDGDDYWINPLKLQKQVDFLELNQDYSMVFHNIELHKQTELGVEVQSFCTETMYREYTYNDIAKNWLVGTCSVLCINNKQYQYIEKNLWYPVQDLPFYLCCASKGKIYYMPEKMSVYRQLLSGSINSEEVKSLKYDLTLILYYKKLFKDFKHYISIQTYSLVLARRYFWMAKKSSDIGNKKLSYKYLVLSLLYNPSIIYKQVVQKLKLFIKKSLY